MRGAYSAETDEFKGDLTHLRNKLALYFKITTCIDPCTQETIMAESVDARGFGLSLRISGRTRFALEFASRLLGQSFSTFVERAVMRMAATDALINGKGWETFWDDSEAIRWLKVYLEPKFPMEHSEAVRRATVIAHREFFYDSNGEPNRARAEVLWPQLEHYAELWQKTKSEHPFAVGEKLTERLKKAGLKSPAWPPK